MAEPSRCERCGHLRHSIAWSDYAQANICRDCYFAQPEVATTAGEPKVSTPKPHRREPNQEFVYKVWDGIIRSTGQAPFYVGAGVIASHCPACHRGTVTIQFIGGSRVKVYSQAGGVGHCSFGCPPDRIAEALQV